MDRIAPVRVNLRAGVLPFFLHSDLLFDWLARAGEECTRAFCDSADDGGVLTDRPHDNVACLI